ncbi:MAG: RNA-guided endonuclease InsQ/TnpB family protein [Nitrososphaerales archaeon]
MTVLKKINAALSAEEQKTIWLVEDAWKDIERQRSDFLHKLSRTLIDKADLLIFEDLQIPNMVKNHALAKSILDASWNKLIQFSSYKASSAGKKVELVDPRGTTQMCSGCGNAVKKSLSERVHRCPTRGLVLDRDLNAALNILVIARGTRELTPVEMRPLLVEISASHVKEAGNSWLFSHGRMSCYSRR